MQNNSDKKDDRSSSSGSKWSDKIPSGEQIREEARHLKNKAEKYIPSEKELKKDANDLKEKAEGYIPSGERIK